jgi:hypothetical protein
MALLDIKTKSPGGFPEAPAARMSLEGESLLARLDRVLGPRYPAFVVLLALLLGVPLALAWYVHEGIEQRTAFWMLSLDPAILVYILTLHPFMHRRWLRAMHSLDALAPLAGSVGPVKTVSRAGEWTAMMLGACAGLAVARHSSESAGWLWLYSEIVSALTFALLAATTYGSVIRSRQLTAYLRSGLELKVFDAHLLTPFAQWGQSLSLVFVGGISVSLLFQSYRTLRSVDSVIIYGCLTVVALTLFFMSMWTVHTALAKAQNKELARVRRDLALAREALVRGRDCETPGPVQDAYLPVVVLGAYERQVLDAPTWPFNLAIVGRVFASVVAPLAVYALKLAFGVDRLL